MSDKPINAQVGDIWTVLLFAKLYEAHPRRIGFSYDDFSSTADERWIEDGAELWEGLVLWLKQESFIRFEHITLGSNREPCVLDCSLTARGLTVLNAYPASLEQKSKSYGEILSDAAKDVAKEQGKKQFSDLIGSLIGSIIRGAAG